MSAPPYALALEAYPEGQRILIRDWSQHAMGSLETWDEGLLAALSNLLPLPLPAAILWGSAGRLFFNGAFEKAFTDRRLVQGQAVGEISDPLWKALIRHQAGAGETMIPINGTPEWWQVMQSPLSDRDGQIKGRLNLLVNISARKLAEQAVKASEETLLTLMDQRPRFLWRSDPSGRPVWINRLGRQFLGIERLETVEPAKLMLAPDLAVMVAEMHEHTSRRQAFEMQVRVRTKDQTTRWCLLHFTPLTDAKGRIHAWSGTGTDIHHWHEAATAASTFLTERGAERSPVDRYGREQFGWIVDVETGRVRALNPQAGDDWGLPRDGPPELWADWLMHLAPEQRERADDALGRAVEGLPLEDVWTFTTAAGVERHVHMMSFAIPDADGVVRQIGGVFSLLQRRMEQRVYLINLVGKVDQGYFAKERALATLEVRVRRFDSFEAFAVVQQDLRRGLIVIRAERACAALKTALPMLSQNRERFPWLVLAQQQVSMADIVDMMRHGATTVLSAKTDRAEIRAAIRAALPPRDPIAQVPVEQIDRLESLSLRERQVLDGLLAGGTNKVIAANLNLSPRTVETHRAHLMDRLGARSLADLMRIVSPQYLAIHAKRAG